MTAEPALETLQTQQIALLDRAQQLIALANDAMKTAHKCMTLAHQHGSLIANWETFDRNSTATESTRTEHHNGGANDDEHERSDQASGTARTASSRGDRVESPGSSDARKEGTISSAGNAGKASNQNAPGCPEAQEAPAQESQGRKEVAEEESPVAVGTTQPVTHPALLAASRIFPHTVAQILYGSGLHACQAVALAMFRNGFTEGQIATVIGCSAEAAMLHISAARKREKVNPQYRKQLAQLTAEVRRG